MKNHNLSQKMEPWTIDALNEQQEVSAKNSAHAVPIAHVLEQLSSVTNGLADTEA